MNIGNIGLASIPTRSLETPAEPAVRVGNTLTHMANLPMPDDSDAAPGEFTQMRSLGSRYYSSEVAPMTDEELASLPQELLSLLGDLRQVALYRIWDHHLALEGTGVVSFIGQDLDAPGRVLLTIATPHSERDVYELFFNRASAPRLVQAMYDAPQR